MKFLNPVKNHQFKHYWVHSYWAFSEIFYLHLPIYTALRLDSVVIHLIALSALPSFWNIICNDKHRFNYPFSVEHKRNSTIYRALFSSIESSSSSELVGSFLNAARFLARRSSGSLSSGRLSSSIIFFSSNQFFLKEKCAQYRKNAVAVMALISAIYCCNAKVVLFAIACYTAGVIVAYNVGVVVSANSFGLSIC